MRRMMQSHKRIGYFFPSLFKKQTPGLREYTQNFRTTEREKHSFFFFPLPRNCLAAAVFPLFRITLPMFRICYKLCIGSISRRDLWPALVAKPPNSPLTYILLPPSDLFCCVFFAGNFEVFNYEMEEV